MSNPFEKYSRPGAPKVEDGVVHSNPTEEWKQHAASVLVQEVKSALDAGDVEGARRLLKAYDNDVSQFSIGTEKDLMEPRRTAQELINAAMEAAQKKDQE